MEALEAYTCYYCPGVFSADRTDGRIALNSDLNNEAVSPHNPDLISPTDWLYSQGNF